METFKNGVQSESEEAGNDNEIFHSCNHCNKIVLNLDYDDEMAKEKNQWANIHLQATLDDVLEALERGCEFAKEITKDSTLTRTNSNSHWELCVHFQDHTKNHSLADRVINFGFWNEDTNTIEHFLGQYFNACIPGGNLASQEILTRPINKLPFAADSRQLIQGWFKECIGRHSECGVVEPTFKPTRLIEISKGAHTWKLRLRSNTMGTVSYTALSYCWGSQEFIKTTRASLTLWMTDLSWALLPKTIQDAIVVTHELGLCYLWVDALCIVQDDNEEIAREISVMNQIYSTAEVTIVAARASHVYEGFLHPRITSESLNFELPYKCGNGNIGTVQLVSPPSTRRDEPLDKRGWAMQERLLARRVLEFGSRQTRLICLADETGHCDGWTPHMEWRYGRHDKLVSRVGMPDAIVVESLTMHSFIKEWHTLVSHYTYRYLSIPSDRVRAISGLAEKFSGRIRGQYLAGLWRVGLPNDLLWHSLTCINKRPSCYQGPSWSWVSVNELINFEEFGEEYGTRFAYDLDIVDNIIELETELAPFGDMKSGSLVVRGRLQPAEWKKSGASWQSDRLRLPSCAGKENFLALRSFSDTEEIDGFGTDWSLVTLLLVRGPRIPRSRREYHLSIYSGLLLRQSGLNVYTRLGMFQFIQDYDDHESEHPETEEQWRARFPFQASWFDDCEVRTVTLI